MTRQFKCQMKNFYDVFEINLDLGTRRRSQRERPVPKSRIKLKAKTLLVTAIYESVIEWMKGIQFA